MANVPRGEEEEREQDCDNIIRGYGLFTEEVVSSNKPLFAEFNPAVSRMDTLLRRSGNFVASYCFCHTVNMKGGTFVAKRHICDHLKVVGALTR